MGGEPGLGLGQALGLRSVLYRAAPSAKGSPQASALPLPGLPFCCGFSPTQQPVAGPALSAAARGPREPKGTRSPHLSPWPPLVLRCSSSALLSRQPLAAALGPHELPWGVLT